MNKQENTEDPAAMRYIDDVIPNLNKLQGKMDNDKIIRSQKHLNKHPILRLSSLYSAIPKYHWCLEEEISRSF